MIKPEDIRINNLVYVPDTGQFVPITAIDKHTGVKVNNSFVFINFNEIEPIPLSEEWLEKMNFKREGGPLSIRLSDNSYLYGQRHESETYYRIGLSVEGYDTNNNCDEFYLDFKIDSVHQLQNLFFSLTAKS